VSAQLTRDDGLVALQQRLTAFARAHLYDPGASVTSVERADGHAGFAYLVELASAGLTTGYFLRLPPPGVKLEGTADVLRQVCALDALAGSAVPHARVVWSGTDPRWFGSPYFLTELVPGETLGTAEAVDAVGCERVRDIGRQAMEALAGIHRVAWQECCTYLGGFPEFEPDIMRWDRFAQRAAEPDLLRLQPAVRERLLTTVPADPQLGLCHGDFQFGNLMGTPDGVLHAIIDWELCGIAPVLSDVGWITAFHDAAAWGPAVRATAKCVDGDELQGHYERATNEPCVDLPWYQALALYKYAVISGFNLMLHRRGKRFDPAWEFRSRGAPHNLQRALELLDA
jgi:aminoglycoside phosphotransferase (APT) family kinase protein